MEAFNYTRALEVAESFFWSFCDDYVELVKSRAYRVGRGGASPPRPRWRSRCRCSCGCSRRCCRSSPRRSGRGGRAARCTAPPGRSPPSCRPAVTRPCVTVAAEALAGVRKAKSDAKQSMRADVETATMIAPAEQVALVEAARSDLTDAGRIADAVGAGRRRPADRGRRPRAGPGGVTASRSDRGDLDGDGAGAGERPVQVSASTPRGRATGRPSPGCDERSRDHAGPCPEVGGRAAASRCRR